MTFARNNRWLLFPVLVVLLAVAYGGSLSNGFIWDDETFIVNNRFVQDISRWPQYFTKPESISNEPVLSKMYRPVQTLSFAVDARLWGTWAGGFHLTSLLLHFATCGSLFFAFRLLIGTTPAVIAALIFAIHPALSEGVLSLAARGNQLYTLFALLSLGLFLRISRPFDRHHILSIVTLVLALFSKEPAIAVVALLPFVQALSGQPWKIPQKRSVLLHAPFLLTAVLYLAARSSVVDTSAAMPYWGGSLWATIQMQCKVFVIYLQLLLWPFHLQGRYTISPPAPFPDPLVIGAVGINTALVILGIVACRYWTRGTLLALAVAWFYLSLAPVANLIPLPGSMMGERFVYFTFAGVIPLVVGFFQDKRWERIRSLGILFIVGILGSWIITDVSRTADWKDNKRFFTLLVKQEPYDGAVQLRMATAEFLSHDVPSSLKRLEMMLEAERLYSKPPDVMVHYWYGRALLAANRPDDAYKEFTLVSSLRPSTEVALFLSEAAARSGNLQKARLILEREAESSPENDAIWNGLGNVLLMAGDLPGAISSYKRALAINPRNQEASVNLGNALRAGRPPG